MSVKVNKKPFKLSQKASSRLNTALARIRKGILNVCEMHSHDSYPSLSQEDFEELYVDKLLGQIITALSVSIRNMMDGLSAQKEKQLAELNKNNPEGQKEQEDEEIQ